jgi:hypothetical protein
MEKEMTMKNFFYGLTLFLIIVLVGCNLPTAQSTPSSPSAAFTQAAQTVAAELTRVSSLASPTPSAPTTTAIPAYTNTPASTDTPVFTPTNTPIPCNLASFVADVTYPDNTHVTPNQVFEKTWRIRNIGSCSWNSSYLLIFDHGDGLGVSSGYTQPLTTSVVNPGQMVDLTVNMTAPAASGTYTSYWRMRDPGGLIFGITPAGGTFLVKIIVVATTSVTLAPSMSESGSVRSDGTIYPGELRVGDTVEDYPIQAFISYDISSIPSNATITEVKDQFNSYTIAGNPFGFLGVLNGYKKDFAVPLVAGNYTSGFPTGNVIDWGATSILDLTEVQPELITALQSKVGSPRFKLRLQFAGSNNDGVADNVSFTNPSLIIKYTTP